jgi:hypothetical protein
MRLVNLTAHKVTLVTPDGDLTIEPSGQVARVSEIYSHIDEIEVGEAKLPFGHVSYSAIEGLPDPEPGVLYIVSRPVAERATDRNDLVVPYRLVRDEAGAVVGAAGLARIVE